MARAEQEAECHHLTVMFCDLADSTALFEQFDPEGLKDVIAEFQKLCVREIETFGGYIARYMDDGILVYFEYPTAHENDPKSPVHAGLDIVTGISALSRSHVCVCMCAAAL